MRLDLFLFLFMGSYPEHHIYVPQKQTALIQSSKKKDILHFL